MSIWVTEMSKARPSRAEDFVIPRTACFEVVYGIELGRGVWAEMDLWTDMNHDRDEPWKGELIYPLLIILPP